MRLLPGRATTPRIRVRKIARMVTRIGRDRPLPKNYIAEWREKRNYTQEELAERVGTTKASISRWENQDRDITWAVMAAIADALACTMHDLLRHPDEPSADALIREKPERRNDAVEIVKTFLRTGT